MSHKAQTLNKVLRIGIIFHSLRGSPLIGLLAQKMYYQKPKFEVKKSRARPNSYRLSNSPNLSLKINDRSLFSRRNFVALPNLQFLQWNLEKEHAHYN